MRRFGADSGRKPPRRGLLILSGIVIAAGLFKTSFGGASIKSPYFTLPNYPAAGAGLAAIFRDDFPFKIPRASGDPRLVIPPARPHCGVKLLNEGAENFALRRQLMKSARRSIDLQTYLFAADATGRETLDIFKAKLAEGVPVRLIVDAYIRLGKQSRQFFAEIEQAGIFIGGYEPPVFSFLNQNYLPSPWQINLRYHEKYLIVDNQVAITGGTNIADEYAGLNAAPGLALRDLDAVFTGPVVGDMSRAFAQNYQEFQELETSRPLWLHRLLNKPEKEAEPAAPAPAPDQPEDYLPVGDFTDPDATVRLLRSRPRHDETYIYQAYIYLLRAAQKSIFLEHSYFIPDHRLLEAITDAARRGVEVVMIVDVGKPKDPQQMQPNIIRYYYLPLLEAGVKVYEWKTAATGDGTLHSKIAVFDQEVSIIGSYNLDPRCMLFNTEDVVVVDSKKVAAALHEYMSAKDLPRCEMITRKKALTFRRPRNLEHLVKLAMALSVKYFW